MYFEAVDHAGHDCGPTAPETQAALKKVDAALSALRDGLEAQDLWDQTQLIAPLTTA
ncbi:MAG: alkaline phosphatase family protein [Candidatus Synoicihabitans palmerolidicus]|nr:alkaline phosphatase family protein [Candidatus Synoicihabitans palmerolidicus]